MNDISSMLDNPTQLLQRLYDTVFVDMPNAVKDLRNARIAKTEANLKYDEEYRKAQMAIQSLAEVEGKKLTIAERELKAKDNVSSFQSEQERADVLASSASDFVFLLKDQRDTLNTLVMWKMAEMKFTPSGEIPDRNVGEPYEIPPWAQDVPEDL